MKAIILAAGRGSRLGKYTQDVPKGMLKISGKTILEIQLECYRHAGINDISIVVGYKAETINYDGVKYYYNNNFDNTNMVVSLMTAENEFTDDTIISYADVLFNPLLLKRAIESPYDAAVLADSNWEAYWRMRYDSTKQDLESLIVTETDNIIEIGRPNVDKKFMTLRYIGLIKFSKKCLQDVKQVVSKAKKDYKETPWKLSGKPYPKAYMTDLLQALIDTDICVNVEKVANGWIEFDTESDYEKALMWIENGAINALLSDFNALIK